MTRIATFKNNKLFGYTHSTRTLDDLRRIKEKDTATKVYEISDEQYELLSIGYEASLTDGVVSIKKPDGWKHPDEIEAEEQARKDSVRDKLEALGLTTDEVKSAFGI